MDQASVVRPTEEVANFFASGPTVGEIAAFRLSDAARERMRELLYKNSAGTLTAAEAEELDEMALLDRIVTLIRSRIGGHEADKE